MPLPLSRWSTPELTGFGRLPDGGRRWRPVRHCRRRHRRRAVTVGAVARRPVEVPPRRQPRPRDADRRRRRRRRRRLGRARPSPAPGRSRGTDAPAYLNVRMPFEGQAPAVPAANPTGVHRRPFTDPAGVARPSRSAARRRGQLDGVRVGQRTLRRRRHRQPSRLDLRRHRRGPCAAATRSASSCRSGAPRRGWRTRTSGGSPACTAASRWCRCRGCRSPTRRPSPGWSRRHHGHARPRHRVSTTPVATRSTAGPTAPTPSRSACTTRRHDGARPLATHRRARRCRCGPSAIRGDPDASAAVEHQVTYTWPGHRVLDRLRVSGIEAVDTTSRRAGTAW